MPDYRGVLPKITWGASFANTLSIGYALDNLSTWSEPREGSAWEQAPSGVEDAWLVGEDFLLEADVRWIPREDTVSPAATGWDGATGVRAFLTWARDKNELRFYPDASGGSYHTCYLVEPMTGAPAVEIDGTRTVRLRLRQSTAAFDGY